MADLVALCDRHPQLSEADRAREVLIDALGLRLRFAKTIALRRLALDDLQREIKARSPAMVAAMEAELLGIVPRPRPQAPGPCA